MSGEVFIAGHSLGAARAFEYAFSRLKRGLRVDGVYAFAPPNPGDSVIGAALAKRLVRSVKNGRDLVTDVPVDLAMLGEAYVQPRPFEEINEDPRAHGMPPGPFAWHHIALYQVGVKKLPPAGVAIEIGAAVDLVARLYTTPTGWDWINPVNGQYWAMARFGDGSRLMIARGSQTELDWLDDFDARQITALGARLSAGFWAGIAPIQDRLDAALA